MNRLPVSSQPVFSKPLSFRRPRRPSPSRIWLIRFQIGWNNQLDDFWYLCSFFLLIIEQIQAWKLIIEDYGASPLFWKNWKLHLCTNKNSLKLVMLWTTLWSRYDLTIPPSMIIVAVASCTWFFAVYPLLREDASCHFRCMLQPFTSASPKEPAPPISSPNGEDVGPVEEAEGRDESLGRFLSIVVAWINWGWLIFCSLSISSSVFLSNHHRSFGKGTWHFLKVCLSMARSHLEISRYAGFFWFEPFSSFSLWHYNGYKNLTIRFATIPYHEETMEVDRLQCKCTSYSIYITAWASDQVPIEGWNFPIRCWRTPAILGRKQRLRQPT